MKTLQELETEKRELHAQLDNRDNWKEISAKLKKNEREITEVKTNIVTGKRRIVTGKHRDWDTS